MNKEQRLRLHATNLQVRVARKEHAKHVPYLSLVPVGTTEDRDDGRYGVRFPCVRLYSDSTGVFDAEQVVYDLEALLPFREIYCGDIHNTLELALGVVPQEGQDRDDCRGCDVENKLVLENGKLLDEFWEALS